MIRRYTYDFEHGTYYDATGASPRTPVVNAADIATLQSIASNSCCNGCNEAALVARAFLTAASTVSEGGR